jgi:hypothetical protein
MPDKEYLGFSVYNRVGSGWCWGFTKRDGYSWEKNGFATQVEAIADMKKYLKDLIKQRKKEAKHAKKENHSH